jgi:hypothetical protein
VFLPRRGLKARNNLGPDRELARSISVTPHLYLVSRTFHCGSPLLGLGELTFQAVQFSGGYVKMTCCFLTTGGQLQGIFMWSFEKAKR